jgi:hypothetical protein
VGLAAAHPSWLHLDWHTVKELEKQYMREQLRRAGTPAPKVIGIDEISIKKRHVYRILVSELVRRAAPGSLPAQRKGARDAGELLAQQEASRGAFRYNVRGPAARPGPALRAPALGYCPFRSRTR